MTDATDRAREALADGRLELDLIAVPLPRTPGWRYTVKLCGHALAEADDYAGLVGVHATGRISIPPGAHELQVSCHRDGADDWTWSASVAPPEPEGAPTVREVACRDHLPGPMFAATAAGAARLASVAGHVEIVWPADDDGPAKAELAVEGAALDSAAVIVTGPDGRVVVEVEHEGEPAKVIVRPLTVMPVAELGRPAMFAAAGPQGPTLRVVEADGISFFKDDGGHTAVCTVLG